MPGGTLNESVFALFMTCIASFIYHKSWLDETVHPENALRCSPFWSETIPSSEHVITCYPWNRSKDTPEFTGLPVDVLYMAKVEKLQMEIIELKHSLLVDDVRIEKAIVDGIENSLDM